MTTTFTLDDLAAIYGEYDEDRRAGIKEKLKGATVVYAVYETGSYEGEWHVVYVLDGKWYEDKGLHCSCNSPEFNPHETTREALLKHAVEHYLIADGSRFLDCVTAHAPR